MSPMTSITLPLDMYYSFVSDIGSLAQKNSSPTAVILAHILLNMAALHPTAYGDMSFKEKRSLRCHGKDAALMVLGSNVIERLKALTCSDERHECLVARALLKEFLSLGIEKRTRMLNDQSASFNDPV